MSLQGMPPFRAHETSPPDDAADWLDAASVWPLRILIAAFLFPIIISFGGHTEFIFPWDTLGEGGGAGLFFLAPLASMALLFGSRFPESVMTRAILCAVAGVLSFAIVSVQSTWVIAAVVIGLLAIVAGNRTSKQFVLHPVPKWVAAAGGAMIVVLCLLPVGGSSVIGAIVHPASWSSGGWMFCLAIAGVLVMAGSAIGLVVPNVDREKMQGLISTSARATMGWLPLSVIFGRMSIGGDLGMFDGGGITTFTLGFKVFGSIYPTLICAATGVAAGLTVWLWENTDVRGPEERGPSAPDEPPVPPQDEALAAVGADPFYRGDE